MPGDSDLIGLGIAWASGFLKAPQVTIIVSGLDVVRAWRVGKHWVSWECRGGALNPGWCVSGGWRKLPRGEEMSELRLDI
jgi:hypothetical protein